MYHIHLSSFVYLLWLQEESADWAKRVVDVANATEDTAAINKVHDAVFEKTMFAVDAPDGEHDLEDVVSAILCTSW